MSGEFLVIGIYELQMKTKGRFLKEINNLWDEGKIGV